MTALAYGASFAARNRRSASPAAWWSGAALSLLAHVGLVVALAFGVQWQSQPPPVMVAELWASVPLARAADPNAVSVSPPEPQTSEAVPPLPEPSARLPIKPVPPPVADAQIATSKPKEKPKENPKESPKEKPTATATATTAAEAARKARLQAQQQAREDARLAQLRNANLQRMLGQAGASSGAAAPRLGPASVAGPSESYAGRIKARIQPLIVFGDNPAANPVTTVEVRLAADGTILGRRVVRGSGLKAWDDAVLRAIDAAQVLPRDTDGRVPPVMEIEFRLRE